MKEKLSEKKWYTGAVVACIGVAFYMLLNNLSTVMAAVGYFFKSFSSIFLGTIFAYIALFSANFDSYAKTLLAFLEKSPLESVINADKLQILSENALTSISDFVATMPEKSRTARRQIQARAFSRQPSR